MTTQMKPILFSKEMVKEILSGNKTQTRRIMPVSNPDAFEEWGWDKLQYNNSHSYREMRCKFGYPPDVMWVREAFRFDHNFDGKDTITYLATGDKVAIDNWQFSEKCTLKFNKNYPSIFMPKVACRLFLKLTEVRGERLQEITFEDMAKEGSKQAKWWDEKQAKYYVNHQFQKLWDSLNLERGYGWDMNPWVFVLTFKVVDKEIDK